MPRPTPHRPSRGAAGAEFLLAALPLLLGGMAVLELAHWQLSRVAVRHALYEAARAGATQGADAKAIAQAFQRALQPLTGRQAPPGMPTWRIERLAPRAEHFADFGQRSPQGGREIAHDYQAERRARDAESGLPQGRGPRSGEDIHAANVLVLEVVHLHPPLMPGMSALLRRLPGNETTDAMQASRRALGWFAVRARVALPMQSAARDTAATSITDRFGPAPPAPAPPPYPPGHACTGLWCLERGADPPAAGGPVTPAPVPDAPPRPGPGDAGEGCGVILCCAA